MESFPQLHVLGIYNLPIYVYMGQFQCRRRPRTTPKTPKKVPHTHIRIYLQISQTTYMKPPADWEPRDVRVEAGCGRKYVLNTLEFIRSLWHYTHTHIHRPHLHNILCVPPSDWGDARQRDGNYTWGLFLHILFVARAKRIRISLVCVLCGSTNYQRAAPGQIDVCVSIEGPLHVYQNVL